MVAFFYAFVFTLFLGSIGAVMWGDRPEKIVAALLLGAFTMTILLRSPGAVRYANVETSVALVDIALFAALIIATIRYDRWWIPCASAFQLLAVISHIAKELNPNLWRLGYHVMETWSSLPIAALLVVGVWSNHLRRRRRNADRT